MSLFQTEITNLTDRMTCVRKAHYNYKNLCTNVDAFFQLRLEIYFVPAYEIMLTASTSTLPVRKGSQLGQIFALLMPFNTE